MWLLDFEYAGMNDPCFDLGNLSVNCGFDVAAEESLMFALPNEIRRDLKAAGMSDKMIHDAASLADTGSLH